MCYCTFSLLLIASAVRLQMQQSWPPAFGLNVFELMEQRRVSHKRAREIAESSALAYGPKPVLVARTVMYQKNIFLKFFWYITVICRYPNSRASNASASRPDRTQLIGCLAAVFVAA